MATKKIKEDEVIRPEVPQLGVGGIIKKNLGFIVPAAAVVVGALFLVLTPSSGAEAAMISGLSVFPIGGGMIGLGVAANHKRKDIKALKKYYVNLEEISTAKTKGHVKKKDFIYKRTKDALNYALRLNGHGLIMANRYSDNVASAPDGRTKKYSKLAKQHMKDIVDSRLKGKTLGKKQLKREDAYDTHDYTRQDMYGMNTSSGQRIIWVDDDVFLLDDRTGVKTNNKKLRDAHEKNVREFEKTIGTDPYTHIISIRDAKGEQHEFKSNSEEILTADMKSFCEIMKDGKFTILETDTRSMGQTGGYTVDSIDQLKKMFKLEPPKSKGKRAGGKDDKGK